MAKTTKIDDQGNTGAPQNDGTLTPNTVLLRRYRVMGVLGGGGMGTVYQARDLQFPDVKRMVAIKEMLAPSSDKALREQTLQTFRREANILATLTHPAIPQIYDFFDQNDRAYLVMEYINGSDLEAILNKTRSLPVQKIIEWSIDLCEVLNYLHSHTPNPIIFRDMKPSNIMIDHLGKVRLIDFGIAKTFVSAKGNTMIGTEGYSAPEQYKGNVSPKSDQYSLGATLHQILTRKDPRLEPPFSFHERPVRDFNEKVPTWFAEIISKSLSFNPTERYENCGEMAAAIKSGMLGQGTQQGSATEIFDEKVSKMKSVEPKWVFKTEDEVRTSPVSHDGRVFIGSYDTNVWALDLETGEMAWKFHTEGGIASSPAVDHSAGLVMFGSEDHTFNAVNCQTGRIVWTYTTQDRIRSSPVIAMDHVFFGSDDGHLYALVSANGRKLWDYDAQSAIRNRPLVTEDLIIFGNSMGDIVAVTLSGERKWGYRAKRDIASSPVLDERENMCYVGSHDGYLYEIDATSGFSSNRFRTMGPVIATPLLYQNLVIFGSVDKTLYAIEMGSLREKWRFTLEDPIVSSPILHKEKIYFGGTDGKLYCVDAATGQEQWTFESEAAITSTPLIVNDTLIFGSLDHKVYALPIFD